MQRSRSSEEPRRSHSPAICRGIVAKRNITTHNGHTYCSSPKRKKDDFGTLFKGIFQRKIISVKMQKHLVPKHHLQASCSHYNTTYGSQLQKTIVLRTQPQQSQGVDATTLPRSAETELQSTIAQHQQQETKGHLETSVPDSTAKRRRAQPWCKRGNNSPQRNVGLPEKTQCFVQILTVKSHLGCVAVPRRSSNSELQTTIASQHITQEQAPFEIPCHSHSTAICRAWIGKHHSTASAAKDKKSPGDLSYSVRKIRARFDGKAATPATVTQARPQFSATKHLFTGKNAMFRANPN